MFTPTPTKRLAWRGCSSALLLVLLAGLTATAAGGEQRNQTGLTVLTYAVGGPAHVKGPQPIDNVVIRVRRSDTGTVVREVKRTRNGRVTFVLAAGLYRIEALLEPPEVVPARPCGTPTVVRVRHGHRARVKLYCSIR